NAYRAMEHSVRITPNRPTAVKRAYTGASVVAPILLVNPPSQPHRAQAALAVASFARSSGTEREKSAGRERVKSARRHGGAGDVFLMVSLAAPFSISFLPCLLHSRGLDGSTNSWLPIFRLLGHAFLKSFPSLSGSFRIG